MSGPGGDLSRSPTSTPPSGPNNAEAFLRLVSEIFQAQRRQILATGGTLDDQDLTALHAADREEARIILSVGRPVDTLASTLPFPRGGGAGAARGAGEEDVADRTTRKALFPPSI